jgi:hypothetical protein
MYFFFITHKYLGETRMISITSIHITISRDITLT